MKVKLTHLFASACLVACSSGALEASNEGIPDDRDVSESDDSDSPESSAPEKVGTSKLKLVLTADGNQLVFHAKQPEGYIGKYPNALGLSDGGKMVVEIQPDGSKVRNCEGGDPSKCIADPFLTNVQQNGGKYVVNVTDVYGVKVAEGPADPTYSSKGGGPGNSVSSQIPGASPGTSTTVPGTTTSSSFGPNTTGSPAGTSGLPGSSSPTSSSPAGTSGGSPSWSPTTPSSPPSSTGPANGPGGPSGGIGSQNGGSPGSFKSPSGNGGTPAGNGYTPPPSSGGYPAQPPANGCSEQAIRNSLCQDLLQTLRSRNIQSDFRCENVSNGMPNLLLGQHFGAPRLGANQAGLCESLLPAGSLPRFAMCGPGGMATATNWLGNANQALIQSGACLFTPLIVDLDGDGIELTSLASGPTFDLLGTGSPVRSSWPGSRDAFLALDRDGNGQIDGGNELFGGATDHHAYADGFEALADIDSNGDGVVDHRDSRFEGLVLWRDKNHNGRSEPGELLSLRDAGITSLSTKSYRLKDSRAFDEFGNDLSMRSSFQKADGGKGTIVDAFLRFSPISKK